jgi:4-cresol dehydrogenase (hydroxylating)
MAAYVAMLDELRSALGKDFVQADPQEVAHLAAGTEPSHTLPRAIVYPNSVDHIRQVLRLANEYRVPVWPCSQGRNWGYGTRSPYLPGSILMMLSRMNRIVEVNAALAYAVIEPGVTYRQLYTYLRNHNVDLWIDPTDGTPDGSVIGNALERGIGETPYGDHFANLCGMEIMLPTGELFWTGGAPSPQRQTWNTYKWGIGPYLEGLFTQSNLGIVTKAGVWLMPKPHSSCMFVFETPDEADLAPVLDRLRTLTLDGLIRTKLHIINSFVLFALAVTAPLFSTSKQPLSRRTVGASEYRDHGIAPWTFTSAIYGTAAEVRVKKRRLRQELGALGKLRFLPSLTVRALQWLLKQRQSASRLGIITIDTMLRWIFGKSAAVLATVPPLHGLLHGIPTDYFLRQAYIYSKRKCPDGVVVKLPPFFGQVAKPRLW